MAERDRRTERRLRYLEDEINNAKERVHHHTERLAELERERDELLGPEEKPAEKPGGGLGDLFKSLTPETIKQVGEAMQGIDLKPILGALGGGGASSLAGALSGLLGGGGLGGGGLGAGALGGAAPAAALSLPALAGPGGGGSGSALDGISEVMTFLSEHQLKGRKLNVNDALAGMKLLQSPNVRALLGTAGALTSLLKGVAKPAAGKAPASAEVAVATPAPLSQPRTLDQPVKFRYLRPEVPAVVEPWAGAASGQWIWVGEGGRA